MLNAKFTPRYVTHCWNLNLRISELPSKRFGVLGESNDVFVIKTIAAEVRKSFLTLSPSEGKLWWAGCLGLEPRETVGAIVDGHCSCGRDNVYCGCP
jgi:hypothetical protein